MVSVSNQSNEFCELQNLDEKNDEDVVTCSGSSRLNTSDLETDEKTEESDEIIIISSEDEDETPLTQNRKRKIPKAFLIDSDSSDSDSSDENEEANSDFIENSSDKQSPSAHRSLYRNKMEDDEIIFLERLFK